MAKVFVSEAPADNYTPPPNNTIDCRVVAEGVRPSPVLDYWAAWEYAKDLLKHGFSGVRYCGVRMREY